jgi:hypothetical protein
MIIHRLKPFLFTAIISALLLFACKAKPEITIDKDNATQFLETYFAKWSAGNIDTVILMTYGTDTMPEASLEKLKIGLLRGRDLITENNGGISEINLIGLQKDKVANMSVLTYIVKYFDGGDSKVRRKLFSQDGQLRLSLEMVE